MSGSVSIEEILPGLESRFDELEAELAVRMADAGRASAQDTREMLGEHGRLRRPVEIWRQYRQLSLELDEVEEMARGTDAAEQQEGRDEREEIDALVAEEKRRLLAERDRLRLELESLLAPPDPETEPARTAVLELRAGTGGGEASIFAADLLRMYARYAARKDWDWETVYLAETETGGCREATVLVAGDCYRWLKSEAGVHRVQRVPQTEAQGRIHTSTCTLVVLPGAEAADEIELPPEDLRIDTYRASGAGGQHVNKTDSAVRVTHLPTGITAECQQDRSQHRNRATAIAILRSRLLQKRLEEQQQREQSQRRTMIAGARRAEKIRTYNFPQQRITDHRLKRSFHRLPEIMDGDLDELLQACAALDAPQQSPQEAP